MTGSNYKALDKLKADMSLIASTLSPDVLDFIASYGEGDVHVTH